MLNQIKKKNVIHITISKKKKIEAKISRDCFLFPYRYIHICSVAKFPFKKLYTKRSLKE